MTTTSEAPSGGVGVGVGALNGTGSVQQDDSYLEEFKKEKKLPVIEIFGPTIQGEGPLSGSKTMFVRFGGCDFRCGMCDSLHSVIPAAVKANARRMTAQEIADELIPAAKATGTPWVTFSGGNPCMHDLNMLISLLQGAEIGIAVETQGTLNPSWLDRVQIVIISPKGPGMKEPHPFDGDKLIAILNRLKGKIPAAIKVVVFSQQDIDFAIDLTHYIHEQSPGAVHPGMLFLSLGNDMPPALIDNKLVSTITAAEHRERLLNSYTSLVEDFVQDERITHFRFLPQLHVLAFSNESER